MGEYWVNGQHKLVPHFHAVDVMDSAYESCGINNLRDFRSRAYVNPSVMNCSSAYPNASCVLMPKKIHINPNFKGLGTFLQNERALESGSVHINPHFNRLKADVSRKVRLRQTSLHLSNRSKGIVNEEEKKHIDVKTFVNKQSHRSLSLVQEVLISGSNSCNMQSKKTISPPSVAITKSTTLYKSSIKVTESSTKLNGNPSFCGKSLNIKTKHRIVNNVDNSKSHHGTYSCKNSERKVLNQFKLINMGKSDIDNEFRLTDCVYDGKRPSVFKSRSDTLRKKEKEQIFSQNMQLHKSKISLRKNSSLNLVTSLIKTKYIYPNKILWHKKTPTPILRRSKHKLDKREVIMESTKTDTISIQHTTTTNHSQKKMMLKTMPVHRVKTVSCLWKSPSNKHKSQNLFIWRKKGKKDTDVWITKKAYPNRTVVKIGGIMYKSTSNKLTRAKEKKREVKAGNTRILVASKMKHHILYVRGEKFLLDPSGKTLIRQPKVVNKTSGNTSVVKRIDLGGMTFIQKSNNVLIRTNTHEARQLVHSAKQRSIALLRHLRKRNNMPCMIYQRFGICRRHNKGICIYTHDPKYIDLCKRFLKGECHNNNCPLSHNAVKEKMATCHFFLKGKCNKENCSYLHVKVNRKAVICRDFLQGFCNLGQNCTKRHIRQCPDFEEKGVCKRSVCCPYPHKTNIKRKRKISKRYKITKSELTKTISPVRNDEDKGNLLEKCGRRALKKDCLPSKCESSKKRKMKMEGRRLEVPDVEDTKNDSIVECIPKRVKLNELPLYIPLQSE